MRCAFILLMAALCARADEICLTSEEDPYLLFGTKTAYIFSNRGIPNAKAHEVPGCQPVAFWLLSRHGSHNPEANETAELQQLVDLKNNIVTNYKNGNFRNTNHRICTADFNLLERWNWKQNSSTAGDLTSDGYVTTQQLAQAWKQRFPGLLTPNTYNYLFKFVEEPRSSNSFRAFSESLFGGQNEGFDAPKENDEKLLRPLKYCDAWKNQVDENNKTLEQKNIFESKQEYKEMISNISLRLGFNYDLQKNTVLSIYQMCRYNKAWDVTQISPWCAAFTREDLKRLEYAEDLETYYKYGYGSTVSEKIGCSIIKDMVDFFKNHAERELRQQPKAMIQLTDYPMILMALTKLGSRQDPAPITGDNYHTNTAQARKWSSSNMVPFNANIAAVLYKCTTNGNFQIKEQYQVLFLENEKPMNIEGCWVGLCDWSAVKSKFDPDKCDLQFCNAAARSTGFISLILTVILFCINN